MDFKPYLDKNIELTIRHFNNHISVHKGKLLSCKGCEICILSIYNKKRVWIPKPHFDKNVTIKILEEKK